MMKDEVIISVEDVTAPFWTLADICPECGQGVKQDQSAIWVYTEKDTEWRLKGCSYYYHTDCFAEALNQSGST